jgi:beta-galactosidase
VLVDDSGLLCWRVDGVDLLDAGPRPNAWRAPTDNDGIRLRPQPSEASGGQILGRWLAYGLDRLAPRVESSNVDQAPEGGVVVTRRERLAAAGRAEGITHATRMVVAPSGTLTVEHVFEVDEALPDLPRIGVQATVPADFEQLEWFGRGPHESYCDRKAGAAVGRWMSTVDEQYVPYVMPQEHGNHTDVRWLALRRADGVGLLVSAVDNVDAKAVHHSDATLFAARHTVDVIRDDVVHLSVDVRQRGLGGASCGPDTLDRYKVPSGATYRLAYRLIPLRRGDDPGALHRRR